MSTEWLIQQWTQRLCQCIEEMTGESPQCAFGPLTGKPSPDSVWWEQDLNIVSSSIWVGTASASRLEIGGLVLKAAGIPDGDAAIQKSTYQEVLNQSLSGLAQALTGRLRKQVECTAGREAGPSFNSVTYSVSLKLGDREYALNAAFSNELLEALNNKKEAAKIAEKSVVAVERAEEKKPEPAGNPKSLDLLLDVELPVSVSFGRAQLPLKDVIKLTTGSIVELNRAVTEPVEIIVNNCVIARGQVVVVEGNFGVRINQVISRQERLRTLN